MQSRSKADETNHKHKPIIAYGHRIQIRQYITIPATSSTGIGFANLKITSNNKLIRNVRSARVRLWCWLLLTCRRRRRQVGDIGVNNVSTEGRHKQGNAIRQLQIRHVCVYRNISVYFHENISYIRSIAYDLVAIRWWCQLSSLCLWVTVCGLCCSLLCSVWDVWCDGDVVW